MFKIKNVSSLEKILPTAENSAAEFNEYSCLLGERFSYQVTFIGDSEWYGAERVNITVNSDLSGNIKIYEVGCVPAMTPGYPTEYDNGFITRQPAIIPDILTPIDGTTTISTLYYKSIWVTVDVPNDTKPGIHSIRIRFEGKDGINGESVFNLNVIAAELPEQSLIFTEWFHCDCIASYYKTEPLSEEHLSYIDKFMHMASENGVNMLLTPIFTPSLDTEIGSERPTVQLIDVEFSNGVYSFGFDKLKRWLEMCKKNKIEYIEISHLFSQWGANNTPKIVVRENGKNIKKFGWHTDSLSDEYKDFLKQLLPELTAFLKDNWDSKKIYFHISDEPNSGHIERYGTISKFIKPYLKDFNLIDAISHYEIYKMGYIDTPVSTILTIDDFIEHGVKNVWAYYCCCEGKFNLPNRFIAMPSYRNRIMGELLYKYNINGFLHWGYNFYYSQLSTKLINPFITNDADGGFPSGDSFSVYPGQDGPLPSLRLFVFYDAIQDIEAMKLAEKLAGRDTVMKLVEEHGDVTFRDYPTGADYILNLRRKINKLIDDYSSAENH